MSIIGIILMWEWPLGKNSYRHQAYRPGFEDKIALLNRYPTDVVIGRTDIVFSLTRFLTLIW